MINVQVFNHKDNEFCEKCGEQVLLGKYCSYECLKEQADKEGKSVVDLMEEMEKLAVLIAEQYDKEK